MPTPPSQSKSLVVSVGVQTNVGKERSENQDRVTRAATPFGDLFVVADGVGGHQGGSEAAQAVVDGFARFLKSNGNQPLSEALQNAVRAVSSDLQQRSAANQALRGMGSTVVLCVVNGNHVTYGHAGDSRLYLIRDGKLGQLTRDHSVMERMISQGILTPAQAKEHPDASVLTRAIGQSSDVSLDIGEITVQPNDALLLCSDGLWGYARHEEMEAVAASTSLTASGVATALLNLALEGGGGDNISIQYLRFQPVKSAKGSRNLLGMPQRKAIPVAVLAVIMAAGTIGLVISNHTLADPNPDSDDIPQETTAPPANNSKLPKQTETTPGPSPAAAHKPPAKTPAGPSANPPSEKQKDSKPKVEVIVIEGAGKSADWAGSLDHVDGVTTSRRTGSKPCLALAKDSAILFHSEKAAADAARIGSQIGISSEEIKPLSSDDLNKCGGGELLAMPAKQSLPERVVDKAKAEAQGPAEKVKTGIDAVKKRVEDLGKPRE